MNTLSLGRSRCLAFAGRFPHTSVMAKCGQVALPEKRQASTRLILEENLRKTIPGERGIAILCARFAPITPAGCDIRQASIPENNFQTMS
ncbi:MAG: hypothetical protein P9E67_13355 [Candidatus Competibacter sp.]|nr:hypothetical protein [Candidatus Competibacter sp.]